MFSVTLVHEACLEAGAHDFCDALHLESVLIAYDRVRIRSARQGA